MNVILGLARFIRAGAAVFSNLKVPVWGLYPGLWGAPVKEALGHIVAGLGHVGVPPQGYELGCTTQLQLHCKL